MTPGKQKAKELIEKFLPRSKGQTEQARLVNAVLSANICIDEILRVAFFTDGSEIYEFLLQVKTEINNYNG